MAEEIDVMMQGAAWKAWKACFLRLSALVKAGKYDEAKEYATFCENLLDMASEIVVQNQTCPSS